MSLNRKVWQAGDIITNAKRIRRQIVAVRATGYTWRYPDIPGETFLSENSTDPFFEWGWEKED